MKNYDEASVVRALNKKQGCSVNSINKVITIDKLADSLGNKSWGKIDFLVHYCKYVYVFTTSGIKKSFTPNDVENIDNKSKTAKRENKINMAAMTKNAMKKAKR